ncbi:TPA: CPBP family intramembrane glutamic endopeptidase, partial [Pseudomonas aeruginosa]
MLKEKPAANSPVEAWKIIADELALIEQDHVPAGLDRMTIHPLDYWMVQPYGAGGFYIPLINGSVRINANGALGIYNAYADKYELQKAGANGVAFTEVAGWHYDFSAKKPEHSSIGQSAEAMRQPAEKSTEPESQLVDLPQEELTLIEEPEPEAAYRIEPFQFWRHLSYALIALMLFFVVPALGGAVIPEESQRYLWVLGQHGTTALALGVLLVISMRTTASSMSLWGSPSPKAIVLGFSAVTGAYLASAAYTYATGTPQEPWMAKLFFGLDGLQASVLIATLLALPPLTEEMLFRYFFVELMPYKRSKLWATGTVAATSLAFAALHSFQ